MLIPDVDFGDAGIMGHGFAIAFSQESNDLASAGFAMPQFVHCQPIGCGQPVNVPLKWPRMSLVKIIDVEKDIAIRGSKKPKIGQMRIATKLNVNASVFSAFSQVMGHQKG